MTSDAENVITSDTVPEGSVAVYFTLDPAPQSLKYCRSCSNGVWDFIYFACPIEFSFKKCDTTQITGINYLVYANNGSKLTRELTPTYVFPRKIYGVYEFGSQKYCKMCNDDGTWSRFPQNELCDKINWII